MKRLLALSCEALARSIYAASATCPNVVKVELLKQGLHNTPKELRSTLQAQIDAISVGTYDAILLVYGMCGRSTIGLAARHTPLVIPRAHDCITLYLGSKEKYQQEFEKHPGTYWYSVDFMERTEPGGNTALGAASLEVDAAEYARYVARWGEETADALIAEVRRWSQHYTRAAFIDTGLGKSTTYEQAARDKAAREGWAFERKQGDRRLIDMLVNGDWPESEFLIVPPGKKIVQTYGDDVIRAE